MNVAVVGAGYWGPNLVRVFTQNPLVDRVTVCDIDRSRLDRMKLLYPAVELKERLEPVFGKFTVALILLTCLIGLNLVQQQLILLNLLKALVGILFAFTFIQVLLRRQIRLFRWIEGYYYQIFLMSWFFHKGIEFLLYRLSNFGFYLVFPASFVCSLFFSISITKLIRNRFSTFKPVIGL